MGHPIYKIIYKKWAEIETKMAIKCLKKVEKAIIWTYVFLVLLIAKRLFKDVENWPIFGRKTAIFRVYRIGIPILLFRQKLLLLFHKYSH